MKNLLYLVLMTISLNGFSQEDLNIELVSNTALPEIGNDVWGWVDSTGTEYAIMGSRTNTWIWTLEDPSAPVLRAQIEGDASTWRDIKSWEDHIYVTTDSGDDGLLIIDMSMAPDSIRSHYITPPIITPQGDTTALGPCHNLYIDENGYCYLAGCRIPNANKAIIFDLNEDKWTPPIVGVHGRVPNGGSYAHDLYAKNNILYSSEINEGLLGIYDVSRKDSLVLLGNINTSFNFTHNAWSSTDQNYVFTTDERPNAFVDAYDVSDPSNIILLDKYQPLETVNQGVIPHNTHYYDGYLVTSWYTDGVVITDVTKPDNMIKVGSFDTFNGPHGNYNGCWGAYPYLPSGLIIAGDRQTGLYILRPEYVRAARLEGLVTNSETGAAINNAEVLINSSQVNYSLSDAGGAYSTGIAEAGSFEVSATHPDYEPASLNVELINGELTILNIEMVEIKKETVTITVVDSETGESIPDAHVIVESFDGISDYRTDEQGTVVETIPVKMYQVSAGAWGYGTAYLPFDPEQSQILNIELEKGDYVDDFNFDLGWTSASNARTGQWVRGIPNGTEFEDRFMAPPADIDTDEGNQCYVTGNADSPEAGADDIDDGFVHLISPAFSISDQLNPHLQFNLWFATGGGSSPLNDTLIVYLHIDSDSIELMRISEETGGWTEPFDIALSELVTDSSELRVSFFTEDLEESGHILEAAVDGFKVIDMGISATEELFDALVKVHPNPFDRSFRVEFEDVQNRSIELINELGSTVWRSNTLEQSILVDVNVPAGLYVLIIEEENGLRYSQKIVKN